MNFTNPREPALGRRLARSCRPNKPSRTRSTPSKIYIPKPPYTGWPAWTGNYSDYGVRMARK